MADFNISQSKVRSFEGGYQAHTSDTGNYVDGKLIGTNHGISAPVLKAWIGRTPTVADMKNLSYDTAVQIYKANYWKPIDGDTLKNQSVADIIYDGAVNHGVGGIKAIVRGILGMDTYSAKAINSANQSKLFESIKTQRENKYGNIGGTFLTGWMKRLGGLSFERKNLWWLAGLGLITAGISYYIITTRK